MKTVAALFLMTFVQFVSSRALSYILPLDFILKKNASLAGNSILSVEQDVTLQEGGKTYTIKESWLIEGDRNLKVTIKGLGELKDVINMTYLYNNKNRTFSNGKTKTTKPATPDFFERYLAIKSKESFLGYMKDMKVADTVRYSRAGGQVCFAVGNISTENDLQPHLWFEQSSFRLAKMRFESDAEIEFTDYLEKENFHYPKTKTVTWDGKKVTIKVTKVTSKNKATIKDFYPESLENEAPVNTLSNMGLAGSVFDEFYTRFR